MLGEEAAAGADPARTVAQRQRRVQRRGRREHLRREGERRHRTRGRLRDQRGRPPRVGEREERAGVEGDGPLEADPAVRLAGGRSAERKAGPRAELDVLGEHGRHRRPDRRGREGRVVVEVGGRRGGPDAIDVAVAGQGHGRAGHEGARLRHRSAKHRDAGSPSQHGDVDGHGADQDRGGDLGGDRAKLPALVGLGRGRCAREHRHDEPAERAAPLLPPGRDARGEAAVLDADDAGRCQEVGRVRRRRPEVGRKLRRLAHGGRSTRRTWTAPLSG